MLWPQVGGVRQSCSAGMGEHTLGEDQKTSVRGRPEKTPSLFLWEKPSELRTLECEVVELGTVCTMASSPGCKLQVRLNVSMVKGLGCFVFSFAF